MHEDLILTKKKPPVETHFHRLRTWRASTATAIDQRQKEQDVPDDFLLASKLASERTIQAQDTQDGTGEEDEALGDVYPSLANGRHKQWTRSKRKDAMAIVVCKEKNSSANN